MPKRIQLKRTKGWRKPEGAVVVSRPSKWGNPFATAGQFRSWLMSGDGWGGQCQCGCTKFVTLKQWRYTDPLTMPEILKIAASAESIRCWRCNRVPESVKLQMRRERILADLHELKGKDLCCWCGEDEDCHADVLLSLANPVESATFDMGGSEGSRSVITVIIEGKQYGPVPIDRVFTDGSPVPITQRYLTIGDIIDAAERII